jgi:hypothetical protein
MPQIDLGQVVGPQGAQGEPGPQGAQGIQGPAGPAATINGVNALIIEAGNNIELSQSGSTTRLSVPTDAAPTEDSTKPVQSGGVAAALSNKAPAGFGLGTSNPRHIDDANNALESGWYYLDASTLNGPESAEYSNVMLVLTRNSNPQTVQVSFNVTDLAFELRRVCTNGVWSPWEWVNPPMQLGVEYRTTERYNSKPVYVKTVDLGRLPDRSNKSVEHGVADIEACFEFYGNYYPTGINLIGNSTYTKLYLNNDTIYISTDLSNASAIVVMKYTKTTD